MDKDWFNHLYQPLLLVLPLLCAPEGQHQLWRASLQSLPCPEAAWFGGRVDEQLLDKRLKTLANIISISWFRVTEFTVSFAWTGIDLEDVTVSVWPCRWPQNAVLFVPCLWLLCWALPGWRKVSLYRILPLRTFLGVVLQCSVQQISLMPCTFIGRSVQMEQDNLSWCFDTFCC